MRPAERKTGRGPPQSPPEGMLLPWLHPQPPVLGLLPPDQWRVSSRCSKPPSAGNGLESSQGTPADAAAPTTSLQSQTCALWAAAWNRENCAPVGQPHGRHARSGSDRGWWPPCTPAPPGPLLKAELRMCQGGKQSLLQAAVRNPSPSLPALAFFEVSTKGMSSSSKSLPCPHATTAGAPCPPRSQNGCSASSLAT